MDFIFHFTEINRNHESRNDTTQDTRNSPPWFECEESGFYADEYDCRKYYMCMRVENKHSKFRRSIYQCDADKVFSDVHMNCTLPQESGRAECGGSVSSEQKDISGTIDLSNKFTSVPIIEYLKTFREHSITTKQIRTQENHIRNSYSFESKRHFISYTIIRLHNYVI